MKTVKIHSSNTIDFYSADTSTTVKIPFIGGIAAGFPSPADDFLDLSIDINKELIKNQSSTFYGRVKGDSMKDAGIENGDLLIVDKSLEPTNGKIAVCYLDGEFTIKRIKIENDCIWLVPANSDFNPIKVTAENDFLIWGIVLHIIKTV